MCFKIDWKLLDSIIYNKQKNRNGHATSTSISDLWDSYFNLSDIKLILDVVPNHTSDKHPWFQQSIDRIDPYTNYYVWKDGKINEDGELEPPNNWKALFGGSAWEWNEKRGQYFLHQFQAFMPDLHYYNPDVHEEMKVGNHDKHRVWNKVGGQLIDAMNMLTTLLPGTNFLYYGEELGMQNNPSGYDPSRAPFQWDNTHNAGFSTAAYTFYPVNDDYTYVNLQKEKEDARSHFHVYQSLMEARKTPTIQNGELYLNVLGNDVFSFSRELEGADRFVVLMNMGEEMETVNPKEVYPSISDPIQIFTSSVDSKYPPGSNVSSTSLSLDPKEAVVLKSY